MRKSKKKLVPRNPLVVEARFKKAGVMDKTKKQKNKKERADAKKLLESDQGFNDKLFLLACLKPI